MRRAPVPKGNPAGVQARADLVAKKTAAIKRARRRTLLILLGIVATCFVLIAATLGSKTPAIQALAGGALVCGFFTGLFLVLVLIGMLLGTSTVHLTMEEYRTLPGALDGDGEHRCVACGHRGIYRRTIYRTSTMLAACSKCEAPLWAGANP